jgi:hypothetical protein
VVTVTGIFYRRVRSARPSRRKGKKYRSATGWLLAQTQAHVTASPAERGEQFTAVPQLCRYTVAETDLLLFEPGLAEAEQRYFEARCASRPAKVLSIAKDEKPYLIDVERSPSAD